MTRRSYIGLVLAMAACAGPAANRPEADLLAGDLVSALVASGSYDAAMPLLRRGIEANPKDPRLHALLGMVLRDKGVYDQAELELRVARDLNPQDAKVHSALGILAAMRDDLAEAEACQRRAVELASQVADYRNNLGFVLYLQGRYADAAGAYAEALRIDPAQRRVYNNLGFAQGRLGQLEEARRSFEQAGTPAAASSNLGLVYELRGDLANARAAYRRAIELDSSLIVARQNLERIETNPEEEP